MENLPSYLYTAVSRNAYTQILTYLFENYLMLQLSIIFFILTNGSCI